MPRTLADFPVEFFDPGFDPSDLDAEGAALFAEFVELENAASDALDAAEWAAHERELIAALGVGQ
jgi:hypothetical protein